MVSKWLTSGKVRSPGKTSSHTLLDQIPVGSYPPNGYKLYDMVGNVWEWTSDWYREHREHKTKSCCVPLNPKGGNQEESLDSHTPNFQIPRKVLKGGSFLCAPNYCQRYRPAARHPETVDTSTCHIGFRCIVNLRVML